MPNEVYILIGTVVGAVVSAGVGMLVAVINNSHQQKLTDKRQDHELALERLRVNHEVRKREVDHFRVYLEATHERLSQISTEYSQTASYIHSEGMKIADYHERHLQNCRVMEKVRASSDLYFPEIRGYVDDMFNAMNLFWGHQQAMMRCERDNNPDGASLAMGKILEASNRIHEDVRLAKFDMRQIASELNKAMQPTPQGGAADG